MASPANNPFTPIVSRLTEEYYLQNSPPFLGASITAIFLTILNMATGTGILLILSHDRERFRVRRLWVFRLHPHSKSPHAYIQPNALAVLGLSAILTSLVWLPWPIMTCLACFTPYSWLNWSTGFNIYNGIVNLPHNIGLWFACFGCMYIVGVPDRVHPFVLNFFLLAWPLVISALSIAFSVRYGITSHRLGNELLGALTVARNLEQQYDVNAQGLDPAAEASLLSSLLRVDSLEKDVIQASRELWGSWIIYSIIVLLLYTVIFMALLYTLQRRKMGLRHSMMLAVPSVAEEAVGTDAITPLPPSRIHRARCFEGSGPLATEALRKDENQIVSSTEVHEKQLLRLQVICFTIATEYVLTIATVGCIIAASAWLLFGLVDIFANKSHFLIVTLIQIGGYLLASNASNVTMILRARYVRRHPAYDVPTVPCSGHG